MPATIRTLNAGATKPDPFTICITANPVLERRYGSLNFVPDPIVSNEAGFDVAANRIVDALFARNPGQMENLFSDPAMLTAVRIVSIFDASLPATDQNSLVAEDNRSEELLVARRTPTQPFLARYGFAADVSFAVSASPTHRRASAWFTSDDDASPGVEFRLDGTMFTHRQRYLIPGTVAIHEQMNALTPLHEFQHAISSYTNGSIVDLYVDGSTGVNNKKARPIPPNYGTYDAIAYSSDLTRDGLGYPSGWRSFHCALIAPAAPSIMDNYKRPTPPVLSIQCQNDEITRQFVIDRIRAKMNR